MVEPRNPINEFSAVEATINSKGWKFIQERYAAEGNALLEKILDPTTYNLPDKGLRDMYVFQLEALKILPRIISDFKIAAEGELVRQKNPEGKRVEK